jgi:hypothetical protein
MSRVIGMHFVCRDDLNVDDHGDGTFETGFWAVAIKHADTVEYVALHEAKDQLSYRQGRVIDWFTVAYEGRERVVFVVRQEGPTRPWMGGGAGEKGYAWAKVPSPSKGFPLRFRELPSISGDRDLEEC